VHVSFDVMQISLKEPFSVSRETYSSHETLILRLGDHELTGFGEATAFAVYGARIEKFIAAIESVRHRLDGYVFTTPGDMWRDFAPALSKEPFIQCAFDVAAHDLWGKIEAKPLYELLGLDVARAPLSDISVGLAELEIMKTKVKGLEGWPIMKIKVGTANDIAILSALRSCTSAIFRVDANGAWNTQEAIAKSLEMERLGVEFIEQPVKRDNWDGARIMRSSSRLPIVADESCTGETDVELCAGVYDGINIKLMKCGGITPALRMIKRARDLDLSVMIGCMPETSVGASAIAHVAPLVDYVDMDSIMFLANDPGRGASLMYGKIIYNSEPGLGVSIES
jgi:L-alanine-DL-glutamate epimerase-like enolase superfamily enzyme